MLDDKTLYDAAYFQTREYDLDKKRLVMYAQEQKRLIAKCGFGDILDVGCGLGSFLSTLDDRFEKYGFDPSEYARRKTEEKGIQTFAGLHQIESESMDVVVVRGVLQHMNKPIETLFQCTRILRRGGHLVILATPDSDSFVYKLFGRLPALDAPRNWIVFGHRELGNILERLQYAEIEFSYPYLGTPYAKPWSDAWRLFVSLFLGWRPFAFPGNQMEVYAVKR